MTIIPRWEWRTFGDRFGPAEAALAAMEPTGVQESDELYLVAEDGQNVKVRDALMDIKLLRETDADGLERWEPVMKAAFPITSDQLVDVARALAIAPPADRDPWTLEDFLGAVSGSGGSIRAVAVHKRRVRYAVGGCTSEVTDVVADGRATRTIAIEHDGRRHGYGPAHGGRDVALPGRLAHPGAVHKVLPASGARRRRAAGHWVVAAGVAAASIDARRPRPAAGASRRSALLEGGVPGNAEHHHGAVLPNGA